MTREHTNAHRTLHAIFSLSTLCCEAKHTKAQTVKSIWRSFYSFESSYLYTAMDNDDGDVYCNEMYWGQQNLILVGCLLVLLQIFCYTIGTRFNFHFSLLWIFLLYFLSFLFISFYFHLFAYLCKCIIVDLLCYPEYVWTDTMAFMQYTELRNNNNNYTFNSLEYFLLPSFAVCVSDFIIILLCSSSTIHSMCAPGRKITFAPNTMLHCHTLTNKKE